MSAASATLIGRALATDEVPSDPTSERILDAALDLVAASGLRPLTMEAAASRAGVGRMTVYRRFGDRQSLIEALAARESRRLIEELDRAVDPALPVAEGIARGFVASLRLIRIHPLLDRFARHEPEAALTALNADRAAILVMSREFVASRLREVKGRGELPEDIDADHAAELIVRLALSFLLMPQSSLPLDDPEQVAEIARTLIAPMLDERA